MIYFILMRLVLSLLSLGSYEATLNILFQLSKNLLQVLSQINQVISITSKSDTDFEMLQLCLEVIIHIQQYKRKMEALIQFLFTQFISQETSSILPRLYKLKPITLTSSLQVLPADLQLLQYLIAKNFVSYSPAHLQIRLDPQSVLFYQRVFKVKDFASKNMHPLFCQLLGSFITNELLPVNFPVKSLNALLNQQKTSTEVKGKKRKESQHNNPQEILDYGRLIYEYSQKSDKKEENVECMVNLLELNQLLRLSKIEELISSRSAEYLKGLTYKEGEEHLESLSFKEMYRIIKENRAKIQFIEQLITKVKEEKIEEYILQTFKKYDIQSTEEGTGFSRELLLVFNLIKKYPLSSEKQLATQSLLPKLSLRKCLNLLVSEGIVNYYPQNLHSVLYRITTYSEIQAKYINHVSQALLNLHHASSNKNLPNEQLLKNECMINDLDDILLIFGY